MVNPVVKLPKQFRAISSIGIIVMVVLLSSCAARIAPAKDTYTSAKDKLVEATVQTSEVLEDVHVKVPESIRVGETFELRFTTIGSWGTKPFFEDEDELQVDLVTVGGRLEPATTTLQGGIDTMQLILSELTSTELSSTTKTIEITVVLKDLNQNLMTKQFTLNIQ